MQELALYRSWELSLAVVACMEQLNVFADVITYTQVMACLECLRANTHAPKGNACVISVSALCDFCVISV
jgi:hypothetical protein